VNSKGAVISLDALLALGIAFVIILGISFYSVNTQTDDYSSVRLKQMAIDSLVVLEKTNTLSTSVLVSNYTPIHSFLAKLPSWVCTEITIYEAESTDTILTSITKTGCTKSPDEISVAKRTFVINNSGTPKTHLAVAKVWRAFE